MEDVWCILMRALRGSLIRFTFKPDGVNLTGTADVMLGEVKWLKFSYDL